MRIFGWMLIVTVLAAPVLVAIGFYHWFELRHEVPTCRSIVGVTGAVLALTSWSLFVAGAFRGWIGGFGSHYITRLDISNFGLAISATGILCALFLRKRSRAFGVISAGIVLILWGGSQLVA